MYYENLKLDRQLCFPLYACSKEIIKKYKPFLDEINLTYTQYIVMLVLWEKDNISVKDLGNALYLDSGTLTPLLKKLEKQGLMQRVRSVSDERSVQVSLTLEGIALKDKAVEIPLKLGECINISPEEALLLYEILYKIIGKKDIKT